MAAEKRTDWVAFAKRSEAYFRGDMSSEEYMAPYASETQQPPAAPESGTETLSRLRDEWDQPAATEATGADREADPLRAAALRWGRAVEAHRVADQRYRDTTITDKEYWDGLQRAEDEVAEARKALDALCLALAREGAGE